MNIDWCTTALYFSSVLFMFFYLVKKYALRISTIKLGTISWLELQVLTSGSFLIYV